MRPASRARRLLDGARGPFASTAPFADWQWRYRSDPGITQDTVAELCGTPASSGYFLEPAHRRLSIQGWPPSDELAADVVSTSDPPPAVALLTFQSPSSPHAARGGNVVCILLGLAVAEKWQGQGLGQALFERTRAIAFEMAQLVLLSEAAKLPAGSPPRPPSTARLIFRIHSGRCFYNPPALLLYNRNGAIVSHTVGGRTQALTAETIRAQAAGKMADPATIAVEFPELELTAPYLGPAAFPGMDEVADGVAFRRLSSVAFVPEYARKTEKRNGAHNDLRSLYNVALKCGSLSLCGKVQHQETGCIAFAVPAHPCALLETYLRDPHNTILDCKGYPMLVLQRDNKGVPVVCARGYLEYGATAATHDPGSQIQRTRNVRLAQEKVALLGLPGYRALLVSLADQLGWPLVRLTKPHQMHILLQDEDLQAGFTWHTDGDGTAVSKARERNLVSLGIQLSDSAATAMWVHGFQPQVYSGRGACVLFHGGCLHRTLPWDELPAGRKGRSIIKIVLFIIAP